MISCRLRCEHSSPLCCAGRPEHLVHTLGGLSGECPRCGYGEPCTVQIVALSSCRWPCVLDSVVDIARQCRYVSACTQLFSTFNVALVSGFKPRSFHVPISVLLHPISALDSVWRLQLLPLIVNISNLNKWWTFSYYHPCVSEPSCLPCVVFVLRCWLCMLSFISSNSLHVHFASFACFSTPLMRCACPPVLAITSLPPPLPLNSLRTFDLAARSSFFWRSRCAHDEHVTAGYGNLHAWSDSALYLHSVRVFVARVRLTACTPMFTGIMTQHPHCF